MIVKPGEVVLASNFLQAFVKEILQKHQHLDQNRVLSPRINEDPKIWYNPKIWCNPKKFNPNQFVSGKKNADITGINRVRAALTQH